MSRDCGLKAKAKLPNPPSEDDMSSMITCKLSEDMKNKFMNPKRASRPMD